MVKHGERRYGLIFGLLALVIVVGLGGASLWQIHSANARTTAVSSELSSTRARLVQLQLAIYHRCQARQDFDDRQLALDGAFRGYYAHLLVNIRQNGAHTTFYRQLVTRVAHVDHRAGVLLTAGAPQGCSQYRPTPVPSDG